MSVDRFGLAAHPEGMTHFELFDAVLAEPIGNFTELTGQAGDVVLAHPFLFHTRGFKHAGPPRLISTTEAGLIDPLRLDRPDRSLYSVLEESIGAALHGPPPIFRNPIRCRF